MFGRHGFQNLAERVKLGQFILKKFSSPKDLEAEKFSPEERLRMCFEELGPTYVKFGQVLATRPDLIPKSFAEEFKTLHDRVATVGFDQIERVLNRHFELSIDEVFLSFDRRPLAAASIAQVYAAQLKSGEEVVVKVQRPGIERTIEDDLNIMYTLAELAQKYLPETRVFNPIGIVDEFFKALELETDFVVEANNLRRFQANFLDDDHVIIPEVYSELSGRKVLVMEKLPGFPLSQKMAFQQEAVDPQVILKIGLKAYMKMVFHDGLFHGDLHAGNLFVLPNNKIGLIDFGVVGRLNYRTQTAIANMFIALAVEDYDRLAYEYLDLAPFSDHVEADKLARALRDLIAPHYGMTLRDINVGKVLLDSTNIAAQHGIGLPSELVMFFKSIMTAEGMSRTIDADFDFMSYTIDFASELVHAKYDPTKMVKGLSVLGRDVSSLISILPRQMKQLLRRANSPQYSLKIDIRELEEVKKSMENSTNLLFLGLVIGSLVMSGSIIYVFDKGPTIINFPIVTLSFYLMAGVLAFMATVNYFRK